MDDLDAWVMDDAALCSSRGQVLLRVLWRKIAHGVITRKVFRAEIDRDLCTS